MNLAFVIGLQVTSKKSKRQKKALKKSEEQRLYLVGMDSVCACVCVSGCIVERSPSVCDAAVC